MGGALRIEVEVEVRAEVEFRVEFNGSLEAVVSSVQCCMYVVVRTQIKAKWFSLIEFTKFD